LNCDDNGTTDPADDTFTISIDPVGEYTSSTYSVTGDLSATNITYGSPYVFDNGGAGFPVGDGEYAFTIVDDVDPLCTISGVSFITPENCASNYFCQDAFILTTNGTYTASGPNQGGGGSNSGRDANWFVFYPPSKGQLTVRSCLEGIDTRLLLHNGSCSNLNNLLLIDDNCEQSAGGNNYASEIVDYCLEENLAYWIEWDDRWSEASFDFEFTFVSTTYYADFDGDGFGDPNNSIAECDALSGYVLDNTDCDDTDPNRFPGNSEICGDGIDNNCDNVIDEGCTTEPCDGDFLVITTISQNTYRAEVNINSDAELASGQDILYTAQNSIDLNSGFEVPAGAVFEAIIDYCVPTTIANEVIQPQDNLTSLMSTFIYKVKRTFKSNNKQLELTVLSSKGSEVLSDLDLENISSNMINKISQLEQGIYFLNVSDGIENVQQKIFIVQ